MIQWVKWLLRGLGVLIFAALGFKVAIKIFRALRWLRNDKSRDLVFFMGPSKSGKTESLMALMLKEFSPTREPSGVGVTKEQVQFGTKKIIALDSAGDGQNIEAYAENVFNIVKKERADSVFLVLVVDMCKIPNLECAVDELGQHLNMFVEICSERRGFSTKAKEWVLDQDAKQLYESGKWAYGILGTHAHGKDAKSCDTLDEMRKRFIEYGYVGKLRPLGLRCLELSNPNDRRELILWVTDVLKNMSGTNR